MGDKKIRVGILTVSDSCSQGVAQDASGDNLEKIVLEVGKMVVEVRECVPDNHDKIKEVLIQWSDVIKLDLILTTGGTGFGNRDVTPEATKEVIEKEAAGISTAIMVESLKITPFAMLSRAVSGVRKNTFIINLPGSKKGSGECLNIVLGCIPHVVSLLRDTTDNIKKEHSVIQGSSHSCSHHHNSHHHHHNHHGDHSGKSQVDISRVARRPREMDRFPMLELNEAINIVLNNASLKETEVVNLRNEESRQNIIGCVLAENIVAKEPFPPFPASIKDGYAVIASDGSGPRRVVGSTIAGSSPDVHPVGEKICVRVNTGAPVPKGMDAVVQVEDTELLEEADDGRTEISVNILRAPAVGQDIRPIGSDIAKNEIILYKNRIITTTDLGLFATLGINEVRIFKSPRIGILSTGDELSKAWSEEHPKPGCIRDSNKITLFHLLKENGFTATDCGIARDNPDDVMKKMSKALEMVDVLITTGSVSMGERDLIKNILTTDLGATIHFGRVNMKPGKPMTFATCKGQDSRDKIVFALPGNPSSAVVTCHVFVLPTLRKLKGIQNYKNQVVLVKLNEKIQLDFRPELKRAVLQLNQVSDLKNELKENGIKAENCGLYEITASTTGNQISSRLASLQGANALLKLPRYSQETKFIEAGSKIEAYVIGKLSYAQ